MLKIEVPDSEVKFASGSLDDGRPWEKHFQRAFAHFPEHISKYPIEFELRVPDARSGHKPGLYSLDTASLMVYRGKLIVSRFPVLVPAK